MTWSAGRNTIEGNNEYPRTCFNSKTTRREVVKKTWAKLLSLGSLGMYHTGITPDKPERPNIVSILSDDHHWDAPSCRGHSIAKTPNMDRLTKEGNAKKDLRLPQEYVKVTAIEGKDSQTRS